MFACVRRFDVRFGRTNKSLERTKFGMFEVRNFQVRTNTNMGHDDIMHTKNFNQKTMKRRDNFLSKCMHRLCYRLFRIRIDSFGHRI